MTPTTRMSSTTPTRKPAAVTTTTKRRATTTTVGRVTTTTKRFSNSTTTMPFRNRTSTTTGRVSASNAPPPKKKAAKVTTTTKPKSEKAGKTPRKLQDDLPSGTPLAPWLPGYRPLDPPKLGSDGPIPERPEGPPPSGAAVADQEGGGPDLPSMIVLAMIPIGVLLVSGAFVAFTRWRRGPISLS